jgi:hypothetical protein
VGPFSNSFSTASDSEAFSVYRSFDFLGEGLAEAFSDDA